MKKISLFVGLSLLSMAVFSEAAAWKPFDGRQGHLAGYRLSEGDLFMQTVIVCRFDPDAEVAPEERKNEFAQALSLKSLKLGDAFCRIECVNVPVKPVSKKKLAELKKSDLGFTAAPGFPWYDNFGLASEPENSEGKYPFYYVVGVDGTVVYSGCSASQAISAAKRDARQSMESGDKLLGPLKVSIHTALAEQLKFGENVAPVAKKLKAIAVGKGSAEEQAEAANILKMLDQSKNYWYKSIVASDDVAMKVVTAELAGKTFPAHKKLFDAPVQKVLADPIVAKAIKMFQALYAYKQKTPEKKSDILKAHKLACQGEKAIAKLRKDFGAKLPAIFVTLENLVMEVKAEMEAAGAGKK